MSDVVELRDLRVTAIVGALAHERLEAQPLTLDIEFSRPFDEAAAGDDLRATTNYAEVLSLVEDVVTNGQFILLETLVRRCADAILAYDEAITEVSVRVAKLVPPVPQRVATVGVRTTRTR